MTGWAVSPVVVRWMCQYLTQIFHGLRWDEVLPHQWNTICISLANSQLSNHFCLLRVQNVLLQLWLVIVLSDWVQCREGLHGWKWWHGESYNLEGHDDKRITKLSNLLGSIYQLFFDLQVDLSRRLGQWQRRTVSWNGWNCASRWLSFVWKTIDISFLMVN